MFQHPRHREAPTHEVMVITNGEERTYTVQADSTAHASMLVRSVYGGKCIPVTIIHIKKL